MSDWAWSVRGQREPAVPPSGVPDELPVLGRGRHHGGGRNGACVMEYVSVLAGQRFTDHPRCTNRTLTRLAWLVNDRIEDDDARARLALLAPWLIGTNRRDARIAEAVTLVCLRAAARAAGTAAPDRGYLRRRINRVEARLSRMDAGSWRERVARVPNAVLAPFGADWSLETAFLLGWNRVRRLSPAARDQWLYDLLSTAIVETRWLLGLPYSGVPSASSALTTRTRIQATDPTDGAWQPQPRD